MHREFIPRSRCGRELRAFGLVFGFSLLGLSLSAIKILAAPAAPSTSRPTPLKPRPGYFIGRALNESGKPLAGVGIRVFGTTMAGRKVNFETKTNAGGIYSVKLPPGNYRLGWAHFFTPAFAGPPYALPLHPVDGSITDQSSARGIVENLVLKISGLISPRKDRANELSYYGGLITVEGGALEKGHFLTGYEYKFPAEAAVELTLTPGGKRADGSMGRVLTLRRPVERGYVAEFRDVPIGHYSVTARLVEKGGKVSPLRVAAARPMSGTSPVYQTPAFADFKAKATIYFPSRGDAIPLLTYGGAAKAPLYVQP